MNELIQQARELCEKATPGPWQLFTNCHPECNGEPWGWIGGASGRITWSGYSGQSNAAFIAASRTLVPQLCDALEAAQKELIDYHHTQKTADGKMAENARLRRINEQLTARAEIAEAERDKANKCIYDTETYFDLGTNKFAYRTIKQYTHDVMEAQKCTES